MMVTWQGNVCVHVADGYDESMQAAQMSLSMKLGYHYGMVGGLSN